MSHRFSGYLFLLFAQNVSVWFFVLAETAITDTAAAVRSLTRVFVGVFIPIKYVTWLNLGDLFSTFRYPHLVSLEIPGSPVYLRVLEPKIVMLDKRKGNLSLSLKKGMGVYYVVTSIQI